jgi:hypothetical protein
LPGPPRGAAAVSDDGFVDAADDDLKGQVSIDVFGLNRAGLVLERRDALLMIQTVLKGLLETAVDLEADPSDPTLEQRLIDKRRELEHSRRRTASIS